MNWLICESANKCGYKRLCAHMTAHTDIGMCGGNGIMCSKTGTLFPAKCVPISENKEKENMNNEIKKGYKVVVEEDGKLVSASVGSGKVTYAKDITVKPRMWGGPLTVFSSPYRAAGFIALLSDEKRPLARIYECEYEPTRAQAVWRLKDLMVDSKCLSKLPEGTVLAKSVKLIERTTVG